MDSRMEYLEALVEESDVVGYHKFILKYDKEKCNSHTYYFIEGEDEKYYKPRVEAISGRKSIFIDCEGREGVISAIELVKSIKEYEEDRIVGFIDKDYFPIDELEEVLVTDFYSIESYYCKEDAVVTILNSHCKLESDHQLLLQTLAEYKNLYDQFVDVISFFSVWSCFQILNTYKEKIKFQNEKTDEYEVFIPTEYISLNNFKLFNHIKMDLTSVSAPSLQSEENIISTSTKSFKFAKRYSDEVINDFILGKAKHEIATYIRGKYELQFLTAFLKLKIPQLNNQYRKRIPQSLEDPLLLFSSYADTSLKLKPHLEEIVKVF